MRVTPSGRSGKAGKAALQQVPDKVPNALKTVTTLAQLNAKKLGNKISTALLSAERCAKW